MVVVVIGKKEATSGCNTVQPVSTPVLVFYTIFVAGTDCCMSVRQEAVREPEVYIWNLRLSSGM
jgi:hypothetical protein